MNNLGINTTKYVQDLSTEKYKAVMKEMKEGLKELEKWNDTPQSWIVKVQHNKYVNAY